MNDVKKDLLEEINRRVQRKKELQVTSADKTTIDAYVLAFIKNIEDITFNSKDIWISLVVLAVDNLENQLRSFDPYCRVVVSWHEAEEQLPQVNGVVIKWSKQYQAKNSCDAELFVDATSLLFK